MNDEGNIIEFPILGRADLPLDDYDRHSGPNAMDRMDRVILAAGTVDAQDDSRDRWVTLPVIAAYHYNEPMIEIGRYSLLPSDALRLAELLTDYANRSHGGAS